MVCKDEMFAWFGHLSGSGRIEVVHGLLNMCMPLELRFAGTCVEFLARKDFRFLKEHELKANNAQEVAKLCAGDWVCDQSVRHKLTVCISLLGSANTLASKYICDALIAGESQQSLVDKLCGAAADAMPEVLLMFTLALCHPAFTFGQKEEIALRLKVVQGIADRLDGKVREQHRGGRKCEAEEGSGGVGGCGEGQGGGQGFVGGTGGNTYTSNDTGYLGSKVTVCLEDAVQDGVSAGSGPLETVATLAMANRGTSTGYLRLGQSAPAGQQAQPGKSHIKNLELKKMNKKKDKRMDYRIQVTWSTGDVTDVSKSQQELCNFHQELIHSFPEDGVNHRQERSIPYFPGPRLASSSSRGEPPADEGMSRMADYLRQLMTKVPPHMLDSELVTSFFKGQQGHSKVPNGPVGNPSSAVAANNPAGPNEAFAPNMPCDDRVARDGVGAADGRVKTLTVYNSQLPADAPATRSATDCARWKASGNAGPSSPTNPVHRAHPSPTSSPSPAQPAPPALYSVQESSLLDRLVKESDRKELEPILRNRTLEEVKALSWDDLEKMNLKPAHLTRIHKILERIKSSCPNGVVTHQDDRVLSPQVQGNCRTEWTQPSSGGIVHACHPQVYMPNMPLDFVLQYSTHLNHHTPRQGYGGQQVPSDSSEYSSPAASPALDRPASRSDSDDNADPVDSEETRGPRPNQPVLQQMPHLQHPPQAPPPTRHQGYQKVKTYPAGHENANVALVHPQQLRGKNPVRGRSNSNGGPGMQDVVRKQVARPQTLGTLGPRAEQVGVEMGTLYTGPTALTYSTVGYVSAQQQGRSPAATPPPQPPTSSSLCSNCTCTCTTTTPHLSFSPSFIPFHLGSAASVTTMFAAGYTPTLHATSQPPPPPQANGYLHGIHNFAYPPPPLNGPGMGPDMMYSAQFQPAAVVQQQLGPSNSGGAGAPQVPGFLTGPTPNVGFHGPGGGAYSQRAFGQHFSVKKPSCYNCGMSGHFGGDCLEVTMEEVTNTGQYRLNLCPDPSDLGDAD